MNDVAQSTVPTRMRAAGRREAQVSDYTELSRLVRAAGLMRRRYLYYWTRITGNVVALAAVAVAVVLLGDSWFQLVLAAVLAAVLTQFGFLGHDAAHRQIFASHRWNDWTGRLVSGLVVGLSHRWWTSKHSRHHAAPNQEGRDPDIAAGALAFTPAVVAGRGPLGARLARIQGWFFFPLLMLEGLNLHIASFVRPPGAARADRRRLELLLMVARHVGYVGGLLVLLPPGKAAAFVAVQLAVFGMLLGGAFAPNHKGMPIVPATLKIDFLRRQVLMSRNVRGGPLTDLAMGGLNYQIEHHLFPSMPRPNLKAAQPLVRAYCRRHAVTYTETGLWQSYAIVVRYLNQVGLGARDPFQCPLVQQYRA